MGCGKGREVNLSRHLAASVLPAVNDPRTFHAIRQHDIMKWEGNAGEGQMTDTSDKAAGVQYPRGTINVNLSNRGEPSSVTVTTTLSSVCRKSPPIPGCYLLIILNATDDHRLSRSSGGHHLSGRGQSKRTRACVRG
ncbi:hypothetical protein J6590_036748 [Homalodisca vitripennis]|nr:hypothetical protein J6590_036748 [Homalodisca vitripennis]